MKLRFTFLAGVSALVAMTAPVKAHHSFAAMYDVNKPVRIQGRLSKVEWTNPHSYFHIDVQNSDGTVTSWACEGAGPGALSRRGFNKSDVRVGDTLIVDGYLSRSGARIMDARRVQLPNGRVVSGDSAGDGGPTAARPAAPAAP